MKNFPWTVRMPLVIHFLTLGTLLPLVTGARAQESDDPSWRLWYQSPAEHFEQSLVMGNGRLGISIFGGVATDSIYLNDITLWSGEPLPPHINPGAKQYIPKIREALDKGDYRAADSLSRYVQGSFSQSYLPMGTLYIEHGNQGDVTQYTRELDLERAVSTVRYRQGGIGYERKYWVSHPHQLIVLELKADKIGALNFRVGFDSPLEFSVRPQGGLLTVQGHAPYHVEPNYRGDMPNAVRYHPQRGMRFVNLIQVKQTDGKVLQTPQGLEVQGAGHAVLLIGAQTSFNGFDRDPVRAGKNYRALALAQMEKGMGVPTQHLFQDHLADHQGLFNRVGLTLGDPGPDTLATDHRLRAYANGAADPYLEALYFHFGRYLLIGSSRTPEVPANLQGLWNPHLRPPWSSNYTTNINVQENYWLAGVANLSELHLPLLSWIGNLSKSGAVSAKDFLGVEKGWMAAHNSDIWAMSNPVGDFGQGHPVWANWYMGGAWLATHIWEHYSFTRDRAFLGEYYPVLKGAAEFCLEWLIERDRELITAPGSSPENLYLTPDGYQGATLYGATADLAIIRELFQQTRKAAVILERDQGFQGELQAALNRLRPYQVGSKGNLQEWYHDWEDTDPRHRHQTHLFGLYPGHHLNREDTPGLLRAAQRTLEMKGDESTGWSKGWRINLWARLGDGEHAYKMYRELLSYVEPDEIRGKGDGGGGTYPNLLDAHPPFQIDGNFSGAAGLVEMLVQSNDGQIELLPALPQAWAKGSFRGICLRGGFELDMSWEDREIKSLEIRSKSEGAIQLKWKGKINAWETRAGQSYVLDKNLTFKNAKPTPLKK